MLDLQVWDCKIVISNEKGLPVGFDTPPRMAAQEAIEDAGFEVLANFSGWGGELDEYEKEILKNDLRRKEKEKEEEEETEVIDIDISDEVFLTLSREAHEQDITFNQLCVNIIKERIYEDTGEVL